MDGIWYVASRSWRRRAGWSLTLMCIVALLVAVPLALVAGARRSSTAFERFVSESRPFDGVVDANGLSPSQLAPVRRLPMVVAANMLEAAPIGVKGRVDARLPILVDIDGGYGRTMGRAKIVEGRRPGAGAVDEMILTPARAKLLDVGVGDRIDFVSFTDEQLKSTDDVVSIPDPAGPTFGMTVVGLGVLPSDLSTSAPGKDVTVLPVAVHDEYGGQMGTGNRALAVVLRPGTDGARFIEAVHRLPGLDGVFIDIDTNTSAPLDLLVRLVVGALLIVALIVVIASLAMLSVVLGQRSALLSGTDATLRAMGLRRSERIAAVALVTAPSMVAGLVLGLIGAALLSPLMPFGLLGRAEPDPGFYLDVLVLSFGLLAISLLLTLISWLMARRATRPIRAPRKAGRTGRWLTRIDLGTARLLGVRYVLDPNGVSGGVPARSAIGGFMAGVTAVVAAVVFAASLSHLLVTPATYGWAWDESVRYQVRVVDVDPAEESRVVESERMMVSDRAVQDAASVQVVTIGLDDHNVEARALSMLKGSSAEVILAGIAPSDGEITLGTATIERLDASIGQTVAVVGGSITKQLRIVGRAVFAGVVDPLPPVADGALLSPADAREFAAAGASSYRTHVVRFAPEVDRRAATRRIEAMVGAPLGGPPVPDEIRRIRDVRFLPWVVVGFVCFSSLLAAGYFLVVATARRRRDLGVLRTLGMEARGVRQVVTWQGLTIAVLGLVVGLPVGIVVGRGLWRVVADALGVAPVITVPPVTLAVVVVVALAIGPVLAIGPARAAARRRPADDLRAPD